MQRYSFFCMFPYDSFFFLGVEVVFWGTYSEALVSVLFVSQQPVSDHMAVEMRALHRLERGRPLLICLTMSRFSSKVCFIIALFLLGFLSNFWGALHPLERGILHYNCLIF